MLTLRWLNYLVPPNTEEEVPVLRAPAPPQPLYFALKSSIEPRLWRGMNSGGVPPRGASPYLVPPPDPRSPTSASHQSGLPSRPAAASLPRPPAFARGASLELLQSPASCASACSRISEQPRSSRRLPTCARNEACSALSEPRPGPYHPCDGPLPPRTRLDGLLGLAASALLPHDCRSDGAGTVPACAHRFKQPHVS